MLGICMARGWGLRHGRGVRVQSSYAWCQDHCPNYRPMASLTRRTSGWSGVGGGALAAAASSSPCLCSSRWTPYGRYVGFRATRARHKATGLLGDVHFVQRCTRRHIQHAPRHRPTGVRPRGGSRRDSCIPPSVLFFIRPLTHATGHHAPQAYTVCDPGEDVAWTLGAIVRSRGLGAQVPAKALEHSDPRQALRVGVG